MEPRTLLSAVTWTGGAGDNNWDTPGNWSTDSVPGSADDVTINIAANVVHSNDVTDSINSLTSKEPLTLSGGTLSIAAASTIDSTLAITGGTLTGTGNLTVSGLVTFTGGTISGSSVLNANGGMLIANNPTGSSTSFVDGRTINNPAGQNVTWTGSNDIRLGNGAVFNNLGSFLAQNDGDFAVGDGAAPSFVNKGSFTSSADFVLNVPFNVPGGSVDVQTGRLILEDGGSSTGAAFNIESQGSLEFWAPYTFDTSTTISGDGELHHLDFSFTQVLPGNSSFAGTTVLDAGGLQVDGSLTDSPVVMNTGDFGTLSGTGTVGPITDDLGGISPGDGTGPGILTANGSVFLGAKDDEGGGLIVALNGPNPGTGYSQLIASGQVDLDPDGSFLDASLGFTPTSGEQFTIIKSTVPVVGQFNGLPEGSSLTIGKTSFTISYHGGDGNDVVLTETGAIAAPTVSGLSPTSGPAAGGTLVTITGTGFTGATAVDFGTTPATGLTVVNATTITVDSPAGNGAVDVMVVTPSGTSATSPADRFNYVGISPTVVSVERFGFHMHPTTLVLTFSAPLDPERADDVNNYQIVALGGGEKDGVVVGHVTRVRAAVYNPSTLTVTLYPRQRLDIHNFYRLTVDGATPDGLRSASGIPFDSHGNGEPGNNYATTLSWKNLVLTPAQARKYFHRSSKR